MTEKHLFFCFLGLHLGHMEVPRLRVWSGLQPLAYATATPTPDLSCVYNLYHSSWQCRIPNPLSEARDQTRILMDTSQIRFRCTTMETLRGPFRCQTLRSLILSVLALHSPLHCLLAQSDEEADPPSKAGATRTRGPTPPQVQPLQTQLYRHRETATASKPG